MRVALLATMLIMTACGNLPPGPRSSSSNTPPPIATTAAPSPATGGSRLTWSAPVVIEPQPSPAAYRIADISCPSVDFCVAVIDNGDAITSTAPTDPRAAWTITRIDREGSGWQRVSCPRVNLCVAIDLLGDVITSINPTGGPRAWTVTRVAGLGLVGVSCPTASFCAAVDVDGHVFISKKPTGGRAAWSTVDLSGGAMYGIQTDGVSCPSPQFCAVAGLDSVLASTSPAVGGSSWTATSLPVPVGDYLNGVFCLSARLCLAFDEFGSIFASTNPGAKSPTWKPAGTGFGPVNDVSCPSADFCVAVTDDGVTSSRSPAADTWTATEDIGGHGWLAVSCPSADACIAGDVSTDLAVGRKVS
jgi:hypothetical protein